MFPLFGQPAVHCSVTGIRSRLFPGRSRPFQFCWYVPNPASSSSRLVVVFVHRICSKRPYVPCFHPVPPETVPVSGAPAVGPVMPPICGRSLNLNWLGSQQQLNLLGGGARGG